MARARQKPAARIWPEVREGEPATAAAWRQAVQERLDSLDDKVDDIRDAVLAPGILGHVCEVGERLLANPSRGTLALAALGVVVLLAVLGWTSSDLATLVRGVMPSALGSP